MASIGATIRGLFGRHERTIAELYRRAFVDLDFLIGDLADLMPLRILEVGCGEGAMTARLTRLFPKAQVLAMDLTPRLGRLFEGDASKVEFRCGDVSALLKEDTAPFDLILLCDVLHHVPDTARVPLLETISQLLAADGTFLFKDWEQRQTPVHWAVVASDRYLTGDEVRFCSVAEMRRVLSQGFTSHEIEERPSVPPWRHNRVFRVRNQRTEPRPTHRH